MRCFALAQAWQAGGGRAVFLSHCEGEAPRRRIEATGVVFLPLDEIHPAPADLRRTLALLEELHADWLVLDGYHFEPSYQQAVRAAGCRLLVFDDYAHQPEYHTDILLNQNIDASRLRYVCDPDTRLLLGTRYVLLRREFLTWGEWRRDAPEVARKVLVTLGGGDPDNVTLKVIRALRHVDVTGLEANIVVGPANPHLEELREAVKQMGGPLRLMTDVTDMPALMAWADVGLAAGGSTCWELAYMGVPSIVIVLAENQAGIAKGLDRAGIVINLGWHDQALEHRIAEALVGLLRAPERRRRMSRAAQQLVDGGGADRVIEALRASLAAARD